MPYYQERDRGADAQLLYTQTPLTVDANGLINNYLTWRATLRPVDEIRGLSVFLNSQPVLWTSKEQIKRRGYETTWVTPIEMSARFTMFWSNKYEGTTTPAVGDPVIGDTCYDILFNHWQPRLPASFAIFDSVYDPQKFRKGWVGNFSRQCEGKVEPTRGRQQFDFVIHPYDIAQLIDEAAY